MLVTELNYFWHCRKKLWTYLHMYLAKFFAIVAVNLRSGIFHDPAKSVE